LLILIDTPLDESEVGYVVRRNSICDHPFVHLDCLIYHVSLDTSLDHAGVHKNSWFHSLGLHLVQNSQRLFDLPQFLIDLSQNGVSHIASLDLELSHILIAFKCHF
jgi:hypothetical protein